MRCVIDLINYYLSIYLSIYLSTWSLSLILSHLSQTSSEAVSRVKRHPWVRCLYRCSVVTWHSSDVQSSHGHQCEITDDCTRLTRRIVHFHRHLQHKSNFHARTLTKPWQDFVLSSSVFSLGSANCYLTHWCLLLHYEHSCKASCARPGNFDIWALWRSGLSVSVPGCQNYKWRLNPIWHRMFITVPTGQQ